jgi:hypothetical protein
MQIVKRVGGPFVVALGIVYKAVDAWGNADFLEGKQPWSMLDNASGYLPWLLIGIGLLWVLWESNALRELRRSLRMMGATDQARTPKDLANTIHDVDKSSKTWNVEEFGVRWETDSSKDAKGRLNVSGPYCPKDLCQLVYTDALDQYSGRVENRIIGGRLDGGLICPECAKTYDWNAKRTVDGELNVEDGRGQARLRLEAAIRREQQSGD